MSDRDELEEMLIIEFGFKKDDLVFHKLVRMLNRYIDQVATRRAAEAHMQGWHEGRAAANNPELKYSYTTGLQPTKGSKDE